jgi:hypothetical protein
MESRYCEVCEKEVDKWKIHRKRQSHRKKNKMYDPEKIELMDEKEKEIHRVSSSQQGESYVLNKNDRGHGEESRSARECKTDRVITDLEDKVASMDQRDRAFLSGFHDIMFGQLRALREAELLGLVRVNSI